MERQVDNVIANSIAIIDLPKIKMNIDKINKYIGQGSEVMPVLKGNAYGHGMIEIAKYITKECGITKIAVAQVREAVQLRKAGIDSMIMILGGIPYNNIKAVVEYDLVVPVFTKEFAEMVSEESIKKNKKTKMHIKIDTGLRRIGVQAGKQLQDLIDFIKDLKGIEIEGMFTHFAESEILDKSFSYEQLELFKKAIDQVKENGLELKYFHCANTSAVSSIPESHYDLVRTGGLYLGYDPSEGEYNRLGLEFALTWKSWVTNVKYVEAGESVGYNRRFMAEKRTKVATLGFGYGDGYIQDLINKGGEVIIKGKKVPIIGICMDQTFVDVTSIDGVKINDEVTILGKDGKCEINVFDLAKKINGPYVYVLSNIGKRVLRIYNN